MFAELVAILLNEAFLTAKAVMARVVGGGNGLQTRGRGHNCDQSTVLMQTLVRTRGSTHDTSSITHVRVRGTTYAVTEKKAAISLTHSLMELSPS
jgi:hypothetical protein